MTLGLNLGLGLGFPTASSGGGGGGGDGSLQDVISSACMDLDATQSASYTDPSQTWANLVTSPADGSAQTDYDFFRGVDGTASADDPIFSTDKFTTNGSDFFNFKKNTVASGRPAALNTLLNTSTGKWWSIVTLEIGSNLSSNDYYFGCGNTSTSLVFLGVESDGDLRIGIQTPTDGFVIISVAIGLTINSTNVIGVSFDATTSTNNIKVWKNSSTPTTASTAISTNTGDIADGNMLLARPASSGAGINTPTQGMPSGTAIRSKAFGNAILSDSEMAAALTVLETRHGVDYTP
jgi:hypothetical protein